MKRFNGKLKASKTRSVSGSLVLQDTSTDPVVTDTDKHIKNIAWSSQSNIFQLKSKTLSDEVGDLYILWPSFHAAGCKYSKRQPSVLRVTARLMSIQLK